MILALLLIVASVAAITIKEALSRGALTVEETASLLAISKWSVYRAVKAGRLPSFRLSGPEGIIRIPAAAVLRIIQADDAAGEMPDNVLDLNRKGKPPKS